MKSQSIAQSENAGSAAAYALLELATGQRSEKVVHWPGTSKNLDVEKRDDKSDLNLIQVYPNPNKGLALLTYNSVEGVEKIEMEVVDASGKLVLHNQLTSTLGGIYDLDCRSWTSGLYNIILKWDGIVVDDVTMSIVK